MRTKAALGQLIKHAANRLIKGAENEGRVLLAVNSVQFPILYFMFLDAQIGLRVCPGGMIMMDGQHCRK